MTYVHMLIAIKTLYKTAKNSKNPLNYQNPSNAF